MIAVSWLGWVGIGYGASVVVGLAWLVVAVTRAPWLWPDGTYRRTAPPEWTSANDAFWERVRARSDARRDELEDLYGRES